MFRAQVAYVRGGWRAALGGGEPPAHAATIRPSVVAERPLKRIPAPESGDQSLSSLPEEASRGLLIFSSIDQGNGKRRGQDASLPHLPNRQSEQVAQQKTPGWTRRKIHPSSATDSGHSGLWHPTARQIYGFTALVGGRNDGFWRAGSGYRGPRAWADHRPPKERGERQLQRVTTTRK